jgi:hypothetical protein
VKSKAASETTASVNAAAGGTGAVTFNTYTNYFNSAPGKSATMVVCVLVFIVGQVIRVAADYWLAIWSSDRLDQSQSWYLVGYWIFVFVLVPYVFFRSWVFLYALLQASRKLHDDLFHAKKTETEQMAYINRLPSLHGDHLVDAVKEFKLLFKEHSREL